MVVRDYVAKNKKEESVQLMSEIVEALLMHRPADFKSADLVFLHRQCSLMVSQAFASYFASRRNSSRFMAAKNFGASCAG